MSAEAPKDDAAMKVDPELHVPTGKFMGMEMTQQARMTVGAIGSLFSVTFHVLAFIFLLIKGGFIGYITCKAYAVITMIAWILMTTEKEYVSSVLDMRYSRLLFLSLLTIQILVVVLGFVLDLAAVIMEIVSIPFVFILYYKLSPFLASCVDTKLSGFKQLFSGGGS